MGIAGTETRQRLLDAAESIIGESPDRSLSARSVCARADVQLPTLYHYFGSKQGLFDALIAQSFARFAAELTTQPDVDPISALRHVWECHGRTARRRPAIYSLMYGRGVTGEQVAGSELPDAVLAAYARDAAAAGALRVSAPEAAWRVHAGAVGAALSSLGSSDDAVDEWSETACASVLSSIARGGSAPAQPASLPLHASALDAALTGDGSEVLSDEERALLHVWLARLVRGRS